MLSFAHDINLNFPAFDPSWSDFFGESQCSPRAYFDLKRLTMIYSQARPRPPICQRRMTTS